jgi:hypothetical protein
MFNEIDQSTNLPRRLDIVDRACFPNQAFPRRPQTTVAEDDSARLTKLKIQASQQCYDPFALSRMKLEQNQGFSKLLESVRRFVDAASFDQGEFFEQPPPNQRRPMTRRFIKNDLHQRICGVRRGKFLLDKAVGNARLCHCAINRRRAIRQRRPNPIAPCDGRASADSGLIAAPPRFYFAWQRAEPAR